MRGKPETQNSAPCPGYIIELNHQTPSSLWILGSQANVTWLKVNPPVLQLVFLVSLAPYLTYLRPYHVSTYQHKFSNDLRGSPRITNTPLSLNKLQGLRVLLSGTRNKGHALFYRDQSDELSSPLAALSLSLGRPYQRTLLRTLGAHLTCYQTDSICEIQDWCSDHPSCDPNQEAGIKISQFSVSFTLSVFSSDNPLAL